MPEAGLLMPDFLFLFDRFYNPEDGVDVLPLLWPINELNRRWLVLR